jgi:hypothetical protein
MKGDDDDAISNEFYTSDLTFDNWLIYPHFKTLLKLLNKGLSIISLH